jgi:hypothetical protein
MGKTITLFCRETPGLKLGPGDEIVFKDGYADVDTAEYPNWSDWAYHSGTPFIRVLDAGEATSATADSFICPTCERPFESERALNAHLLSHRPKTAKPAATAPTPKPKAVAKARPRRRSKAKPVASTTTITTPVTPPTTS